MANTKIVDLSHALDAASSIYPGDPAFSACPHLTLSEHGVNVQKLDIGSHTGTHIDAPFHFVQQGRTIDEIPLENLIGPAIVINLTEPSRAHALQKREVIQWNDLASYEDTMKHHVSTGQRPIVLLRTDWSRYWSADEYIDHPYLSAEAAQRIVDIGIRTIGIDTFSPDETYHENETIPEPSFMVHKIVLTAGAVIAENLTNLKEIQEGVWIVSLVPLKIGGCDGSPVRACAWRKGAF